MAEMDRREADAMKDILLALCVGLMFVAGYFPARRLDRFLERNREAMEGKGEASSTLPSGERARSARAFGYGAPLPGGWRGSGLLPLRHRS